MGLFRLFFSVSVVFSLFLSVSMPLYAGNSPVVVGGEAEDQVILDTFHMELASVPPICIDASVLLTCGDEYDDRDVLEYKWINKATGVVVSQQRSVRVYPRVTTVYELRITYIDRERDLIRNGDFKQGYKEFRTDYTLAPSNGSEALWNEGYYKLGVRGNQYHPHFWNTYDHTVGNATGNMMLVNGHGGNNVRVWEQDIMNIVPGVKYAFSAWGASLTDGHRRVGDIIVGWGQYLPQWQFSINNVLFGKVFQVQHKEWLQFFSVWESGSATRATIKLVDKIRASDGNDFALDDISFAPVKEGVGSVTVQVLPQVDLAALSNLTVCESGDIVVKANAVGSGKLTYEWKKDGRLVDEDSVMEIRNVQLSHAGEYECRVTGTCGTKPQAFDLTVFEKLRNQGVKVDTVTVCKGSEVELNGDRCTGYNLSYRWSGPDKWTAGAGWIPAVANTKSYTKLSVGLADLGKYNCIVKAGGGCGTDTVYTVLRLREGLQTYPLVAEKSVCQGTTVKWHLDALHPGVDVSWSLPDGRVVRRDTLVIEDVKLSDAGVYRCILKNDCDFISRPVLLNVYRTMGNFTISRDTSVCENSSVTFRAGATGDGLRYEWAGPSGFRASTAEITVDRVSAVNIGSYQVSVTDTCGRILAGQVALGLLKEYESVVVTPDTTVCPGADVVLRAVGRRTGLSYEWMKDGAVLGTGKSYKITGADVLKAGNYVCRIKGVCSPEDRNINVGLLPEYDPYRTDSVISVCEGSSVVLRVEPAAVDVRYEWTKDGSPVGDGTASLVLENVRTGEAGRYLCRTVSRCGEKTLWFEVGLKAPTKILSYTPDQYINEGGMMTLFVNAEGEPPVNYEWRRNDTLIGGNSNKLIIENVGGSGVYHFTCEVRALCGRAIVPITVIVGKYNVLTEDTEVTVCEGKSFSYTAAARPAGCPAGAALTYRWEFGGKVLSTTSLLKIENMNSGKTGRYVCKITGACGSKVLNLDMKMTEIPRILSFPDTIWACEGQRLRIGGRVKGNDLLTFEWKKDGGLLGGTDSVYTIQSALPSSSGIYSCKVSGQCGDDQRSGVLVVREALRITEASGKVSACIGDPVIFSVKASGHELTYKWYGPAAGNWSGATSPEYRNSSVSVKDAGDYRCVVNSTCGSGTVYPVLEVEKELVILERPQNRVVCTGSGTEFTVLVNLADVAYTWTLPDGSIRNGAALKLAGVQPADTGVYNYSVKSRCSTVYGSVRLGVYRQLEDFVVSRDTAVCKLDSVVFRASATGEGLVYRWMGPRRFTSDRPVITVRQVDSLKTGNYEVAVTDVCNRSMYGRVSLSLLEEFGKISISRDTAVCAGSGLTLEVKGGVAGMRYEWRFQNRIVGDGARLALVDVSSDDAGEYVCRVTGTCRTEEYKVVVGVSRSLTATQPIDLIRECPHADVEFPVVADGEDVHYVWSRNGSEVGHRDSVLRIEDIIAPDAGRYVCRVVSACGVKEFGYELQVKGVTVIKSHTPDKFVTENDEIQLVVRAEGENNVYEWWQDGVLAGSENQLLFVPDVGLADTIYFMCAVKGDCGVDTARMQVKVGTYKPIRETTSPDTLCEGSTYTYVANMIPENCYGDENLKYVWMHDGDTLSKTPLLRLEDLRVEQEGRYTCWVGSDCGQEVKHWDIRIFRLPQIDSVSADAYVVEGAGHKIGVVASGDDLCYSWTKDGVFYDRGTELVFDPALYEDRGVYQVTVSNRCSGVKARSELDVWRKTTIVLYDRDVAVCRGGDTVLCVKALGAPGLVYKWYHNGVQLSVPMVQPLVLKQVRPEDAGEYRCVVSGRGGEDSCTMYLTVNELPEFVVDGKFEMCQDERELSQQYEGQSRELLDYRWSVTGGLPVESDGRTVDVVWKGDEKAVLAVRAVSLLTGCKAEKRENITFFRLPEVYLDLPEFVGYCLDSLRLDNAYPTGGYYLVNGVGSGSVRFENKDEIYEVKYCYTDTVTTCSSQAVAGVRADAEPVIELKDAEVVTGLCRPVVLEVEKVSAGGIEWNGQGNYEVGAGSEEVRYTPDVADGRNVYFKAVLTDKYGCMASDGVIVEVVPLPEIRVSADSFVGMCTPLVLYSEYYTERFKGLLWHPADELKINADYSAEVIKRTDGVDEWWAVVTDQFDCQGSDTVRVRIQASPPLEDDEFCEDVPLTVDCRDYHGYRWSDGYEDSFRVLGKAGEYMLRITDQFDCVGDVHYHVHPVPPVRLADTVIYTDQSMLYELNLDDKYSPYDIEWGDGSRSMSLEVDQTGYYSVKVTDNIGCTASDTAYLDVKMRAIAAPNAFLPSSNGENSKFYLKEVNFGSTFEMFIYDRWGELVFRTNEIGFNGGWDGSFKGMACLPGAYVWVAFVDGKEAAKGTVMLVK